MERNLKESSPRFYSKVLIPLETEVHNSNVIRELISPVLPKRKGSLRDESYRGMCDCRYRTCRFNFSLLVENSDSRGGRREPTYAGSRPMWMESYRFTELIVAKPIFRAIQRTL